MKAKQDRQRDKQSVPTSGKRKLSRKKRALFAFIAALLSFVLFAIFGEVLVRLLAPQPLLPRYVTDSGFGIRVHCPDIETHHTTGDYRITIRTNSMGIRSDREFTFAKPDGVFRIAVLGDSFTFGYGVEAEQTYSALLERRLQKRGINAEVLNLGVSGAGTAEELIMLKERGSKFDPDMVVLGYCTNDIKNNTASMLYALNGKGSIIRKRKEYLPAVKVRDFLYSFAVYRFLAERSHLLYFLRNSLSEFLQERQIRKNIARESLSSQDEERLTAALLHEIKRTCERQGAMFLLLDIPSASIRSSLPRRFLTTVTDEDIIDLQPTFKKRMKATKLYWTRSDGHWTPDGHQIAAELLAQRIEERLAASGEAPCSVTDRAR